MVFAVDERMLTSSRQETHAENRSRLVSSRHLTAAHTVRYDLVEELIPFFEKQCVTQVLARILCVIVFVRARAHACVCVVRV